MLVLVAARLLGEDKHKAPSLPLYHSLSLRILSNINEMSCDGGGGGHGGTDEVGATAASLAALKVAIAGRSATLTWLQPVSVHAQAHGTT